MEELLVFLQPLSLTCQRLSWSLPSSKEWEKLSGLDLASQTEDKSRRAVQNFHEGTVIVEKGPHTRIWTSGQEEGYQLDVGGPYQATGGMGDTLAGMIAGFAGQFPQVSLYERVVVATYLHSAIAEDLSKELMWFYRQPSAKKSPNG